MKSEGSKNSPPQIARKESLELKLVSKASDYGRFLGAALIFYYHMGLAINCPQFKWGEYAVCFFIILSGIAYTTFSSTKPTDLFSYKKYIIGRLKVIFPIFLLINVTIFLASHIYPSALGRPFTITEFLLSATGVSQYFDYRYMSIVMWFIPFIIQAYLLFPLIDYCLNRVSALYVILTAFAISLSLIELIYWCWPDQATHICRDWSVVFRLPEVCMGLILGRCFLNRRDCRGEVAALAIFAIITFLLATTGAAHFTHQGYILALPWKGLIVTTIIAIVSILLAITLKQIKDKGLIRLLGTASFPFYLMHGIMISFIFHRFKDNSIAWVAYFIFCWVAAIVLALASRCIEHAIRTK